MSGNRTPQETDPAPMPTESAPAAGAGVRRTPQQQADYWVNGPCLVVRLNAVLPSRCIKCNKPTGHVMRKRMVWADTQTKPAGGMLAKIPIVKYFFAFQSMFRWFSDLRTLQAPAVTIPICARHRTTAWLLTAVAWLALPAGLLFVVLVPRNPAVFIWGPTLGLFTSAIAWSRPRP